MPVPPVPPPFSYAEIDALLLAVARELPRRPNWYASLARLGGSATAETRLPVYQAVRDDGCLPEDAGFFLVSFAIENLARDAARRAQPDKPKNVRQPRRGKSARKRALLETFAAYGESEMHDLFRNYGDEFEQRYEQGRRFFVDPRESGPAEMRGAIQELADRIRKCAGSRAPMGPLACRWSVDYGFIDLEMFPTPIELVGGPDDGAVVDPDVDFDLLRILEAFDRVDGLGWTLDGEDRECHYVGFRGAYRGYDVWVTLFAGAPAGEKPTMKSDELRKWRAFRGDSVN